MSPRVIVQIEPDVVRQVQDGQGRTAAGSEVLTTARALGVQLRALHPGVGDRTLQSYFVAGVPEPARAEEVCRELLACEAVQGAYLEASAEPPMSMGG